MEEKTIEKIIDEKVLKLSKIFPVGIPTIYQDYDEVWNGPYEKHTLYKGAEIGFKLVKDVRYTLTQLKKASEIIGSEPVLMNNELRFKVKLEGEV